MAVSGEVLSYLDAVTRRVAAAYGDDLFAVYTTGSLALDAYEPGRSDVDLMAVVGDDAPLDLPRVLAARLDHRALSCPAAGLEFVLYPRTTAVSGTLDAGYVLNLNTGRELPSLMSTDPGDGPAFWYVIDRAIAHQSGHALLGPPASTVLQPAPFERLLPVLADAVEAHAPRGPDDHLLDNAVLNACRALRYAEDRRWYAKLDAGRRTLAEAGEFAPLVATAMASFGRGRRAADGLGREHVREFLADVLVRLRAHAHAASTDAMSLSRQPALVRGSTSYRAYAAPITGWATLRTRVPPSVTPFSHPMCAWPCTARSAPARSMLSPSR